MTPSSNNSSGKRRPLTEGGWCQLLANWTSVSAARLAGPHRRLDRDRSAWAVQREQLDPVGVRGVLVARRGPHGRPEYTTRYDDGCAGSTSTGRGDRHGLDHPAQRSRRATPRHGRTRSSGPIGPHVLHRFERRGRPAGRPDRPAPARRRRRGPGDQRVSQAPRTRHDRAEAAAWDAQAPSRSTPCWRVSSVPVTATSAPVRSSTHWPSLMDRPVDVLSEYLPKIRNPCRWKAFSTTESPPPSTLLGVHPDVRLGRADPDRTCRPCCSHGRRSAGAS